MSEVNKTGQQAPAVESVAEEPSWPLASLSTLVDDYPQALVRMASLRAEKKQYLLFGWIELYPFDMQPPKGWKAGAKPWPVPGRKEWSCGASATLLSTTDALHWYLQAVRGNVSFPSDGAPKAVMLNSPPLAPEPGLGRFSVEQDIPFAYRWHNGPRLHRLVPLKPTALPVRQLADDSNARTWLSRNFDFDPLEHEDWLGGLALLAPDPVCSSFAVRPCERSSDGQEVLGIRATPRRAKHRSADLSTLSVHIGERRLGGWAYAGAINIPQEGFTSVSMPQVSDHISWALICNKRGLLRFSEPTPWIHQISFDLAMSAGTAEVEVPSGGRRKPAKHFTAPLQTTSSPTTIGTPPDQRGLKRLRMLAAKRDKRKRLQQAPQKVFGVGLSANPASPAVIQAKKEDAEKFIVDIVAKARRRLIFVDPYFGVREMRNFALRNSFERVQPRILTGLEALQVDVGDAQGFKCQQGVVLAADLRRLSGDLKERTPLVRVMPGQNAVIHDRFLVADDDVWFVGPSFNELGERLGLIVRLPNPVEVRWMIHRVWMRSTLLLEMAPASISGKIDG